MIIYNYKINYIHTKYINKFNHVIDKYKKNIIIYTHYLF